MTRLLVWISVLAMPAVALGQGRVATPTFSAEGGEYSTLVMVTIRVSTHGATIRYTQNGLDPTESDPLIVSGSTIAINRTVTLKARAFANGRRPSDVKTATYTIVVAAGAAAVGNGDVAAGRNRTILATPDGRVFEWSRQEPARHVEGIADAIAVSAGDHHALALTNDGRVFEWEQTNSSKDGRTRRQGPKRVSGLPSVVRIAAGGDHRLALSADGRVWAWGSNGHGQLGSRPGRPPREPIVVPSLRDVVAIGAGNAHSVAVTRAGEVFAWGANTHGQLGDGTRTARWIPTRVAVADIADIAAGETHTLAMTRAGLVYSWGSGGRGELGTGSLEAATQPVEIADLRAAAIRAGRRFSAALARDGVLMLWGANESGQLADGTHTDRSTPSAGPALTSISALALGGRHAVAVTSSGDVWTWGRNFDLSETMSAVEDWGPPLVEESVAAPIIEPSSGSYPAPQTVRLSSTTSGATVRYTLDGSEPSTESTLYTGPFVVATNAEVRARAFAQRVDGEPSPESAATYVIDMVPPTISAEVSPPLTLEWYTTPVTITFQCADDSGSVSCSPPVTLSSDGAEQLATGVAIDPAGNRATASVTVNIDRTAPVVLLETFAGGGTTDQGEVLLRGRIYDTASGLAESLRCNGTPTAVVQELFECRVSLRPGRNSISLQASDVAGHVAAAGIVITRAGEPTSIAIAPDARTMVITDVAALSLLDDFGVPIRGALWTSSDENVAALSQDDPPAVTAVSPGTATITATRNGISAEATITVQAAALLAEGTARWAIKATPGLTIAAPMLSHRVDLSVPDLFLVESDTSGTATVRAVSADGEVLWREPSPGPPLMADTFGGVIAGVYQEFSFQYKAIARLGNAGGVPPWRYDARGSLERPAQAADGTLYAIELVPSLTADGKQIRDKHVVVIDGRSGRLLRRVPLARELDIFTAEFDGLVVRERPRLVCESSRREDAPRTIGPIAAGDGRGYLLVRRVIRRSFDACVEQLARPQRTIDHGIDLVILSPTADPVVQPIFGDQCDVAAFQFASCDVVPATLQLVPDGVGGILASWDRFDRYLPSNLAVRQRVMTRRSADGVLKDMAVDNTTAIHTVGQGGVSYVFGSGAWSAVDITTWSSKWTTNLGTFSPLAAHPDGGLAVYDAFSGDMRVVNSHGQPDGQPPVHLGRMQLFVQEFGGWLGVRDGALVAVAGEFPDATRFAPFIGNTQFQLAERKPGLGLYMKSQYAVEPIPIHHTALWIVPSNQSWIADWYQQQPDLQPQRDEFGNLMFSLGAGLPDGRDSTINCAVPGAERLVKGINRAGDLTKPARGKRRLPVAPWDEIFAIPDLLTVHTRYTDDAPYACFPDSFVGFFNSNSYVHSLLDYANVPHSASAPGWPAPGWNVLLPATYFPVR